MDYIKKKQGQISNDTLSCRQVLLYHGTSSKTAKMIEDSGYFRASMGTSVGLLGQKVNYFTPDKEAAWRYANGKAGRDGGEPVLLEVQFFTGNVFIIDQDSYDFQQAQIAGSGGAAAGLASQQVPAAGGHFKSAANWLEQEDVNCAYAREGILDKDGKSCEQIGIRQDIPWRNVCPPGTIKKVNDNYTAMIDQFVRANRGTKRGTKRIKTSNKDKDVPAEILEKCVEYGEWWEDDDKQQSFNEKFEDLVMKSPLDFEDFHTIARTVKYIVSGRTKTTRGNIIGATVARTKENIVPKILMHDGAFILEAIYCEDEEFFTVVTKEFKELNEGLDFFNPR